MKNDKVPTLQDKLQVVNKMLDEAMPGLTARQKIGKFEIINERPEGMNYEEYKRVRRNQTKLLKNARRS